MLAWMKLVERHNALMDDDGDGGIPHDGWAACSCALAREIRATMPDLDSSCGFGIES